VVQAGDVAGFVGQVDRDGLGGAGGGKRNHEADSQGSEASMEQIRSEGATREAVSEVLGVMSHFQNSLPTNRKSRWR
jgi:hypothetical protein